MHVRGEAVRGDHVKPRARQEHDARGFGLRIERCQGFEALDLAADIDVMRASPQAGFRHLFEGEDKGTRAVNHQTGGAQGVVQSG